MRELEYKIVRSPRRKTLTITVERDRSIVVHAPESASDETVHKVVAAKRQWIFGKIHHAQKYQALAHPPGKEVVSGESAPYLGWIIELRSPKQRVARLSSRVASWYPFLIKASGAKH
jgi:predicted metal-dependent hydrolase